MNLLAARAFAATNWNLFYHKGLIACSYFPEKEAVSLFYLYAAYLAKACFNNRYLLAFLHFRQSRSFSTHPVYGSATWLFPLAYHGTFRRRISTRRGIYLTFTRSIISLNRFWRPYAMGRERVFRYWQYFSFQISCFFYRKIKLSLTSNNRPFNFNY